MHVYDRRTHSRRRRRSPLLCPSTFPVRRAGVFPAQPTVRGCRRSCLASRRRRSSARSSAGIACSAIFRKFANASSRGAGVRVRSNWIIPPWWSPKKLLLDSLGQAMPDVSGDGHRLDCLRLTASAARGGKHSFGSRTASATQVELKTTAEPAACWIESIEDGWLFLIASAPGSGWLLSVGLRPDELLDQSRLIREQIAGCQPAAAQFAASPRIMAPLGEPGWIACGTAAMAFDPLCGDGTAHAVREAILASAVIGAAARGEDPIPLLAHYEARLTAGFRRHLAHCLQYYASGCGGPWWQAEAESTLTGSRLVRPPAEPPCHVSV